MKKLSLVNKKDFVIVDDDDYEKLKIFNWHRNGNYYAGNSKLGLMHRFITNCPKNMVVDHINRNRLDNRKSNLKVCTQSENMKNSSKNHPMSNYYTNLIGIQTIQIIKTTYEKLKNIADKRSMKLYGLLTMIVNEWIEKENKKG